MPPDVSKRDPLECRTLKPVTMSVFSDVCLHSAWLGRWFHAGGWQCGRRVFGTQKCYTWLGTGRFCSSCFLLSCCRNHTFHPFRCMNRTICWILFGDRSWFAKPSCPSGSGIQRRSTLLSETDLYDVSPWPRAGRNRHDSQSGG